VSIARRRTAVAWLVVAGAVASGAWAQPAPERPGERPPPAVPGQGRSLVAPPGLARQQAEVQALERERMWEAILLALRQRGVPVRTAVKADGRVVTEFVALGVAALAEVASLDAGDRDMRWAGAECAYDISIKETQRFLRLGVTARIRAWDGDQQGAAGPGTRSLRSRRVLERQMTQAILAALASLEPDDEEAD
jgi:hypothetical protein